MWWNGGLERDDHGGSLCYPYPWDQCEPWGTTA